MMDEKDIFPIKKDKIDQKDNEKGKPKGTIFLETKNNGRLSN